MSVYMSGLFVKCVCVYVFLQQSPDYPNFQYLCKLCSVHVDNIQGAHKHIKEKRHKKNIMVTHIHTR